MRPWTLFVAVAGLCGLGCNREPAGGDPDASAACSDSASPANLGRIAVDGGCRACSHSYFSDPAGDAVCQAEYAATIPAGCRAYCDSSGPGLCKRTCPDECSFVPDAGGCVPGTLACTEAYGKAFIVCDPTCGTGGGCRRCAFDSECEAELGPGSACIRHCGMCSWPRDRPPPNGGLVDCL